MKNILIILAVIIGFSSCNRVPITGRKQLNLLPESMLMEMSLTSYREFLMENPVSTNQSKVRQVNRVGQNIATAVESFMSKDKKMAKRIEGYEWEFALVENELVNAWCMPGGKVVVYTGIMPIAKTDAGLAVIMGHEIAHAVARHGNERMSTGLLIQMGGIALSVALSEKPEETQNLFLAAYGLGSVIGIALPYSRSHESEADKLGMVFMAMAGYDPQEAINFWERMQDQGGGKVPEFLSTHPSDQRRINDLKEFLPEALKYYKR
ncbi:MAG: M48 family metallopeptidase [Bacteroidetes bacterium]|nr:M48 family metallopeptidase [Bacteroidota bacterium]